MQPNNVSGVMVLDFYISFVQYCVVRLLKTVMYLIVLVELKHFHAVSCLTLDTRYDAAL